MIDYEYWVAMKNGWYTMSLEDYESLPPSRVEHFKGFEMAQRKKDEAKENGTVTIEEVKSFGGFT